MTFKSIINKLIIVALISTSLLSYSSKPNAQGFNDAAQTENYKITASFSVEVFDQTVSGIEEYQKNNLPFYCTHLVSIKKGDPGEYINFTYSDIPITDGKYIWGGSGAFVIDIVNNRAISNEEWNQKYSDYESNAQNVQKFDYQYVKTHFERLFIDQLDPTAETCSLFDIQFQYILILVLTCFLLMIVMSAVFIYQIKIRKK